MSDKFDKRGAVYPPDCADCPTPAECKAANDCKVLRQIRHGRERSPADIGREIKAALSAERVPERRVLGDVLKERFEAEQTVVPCAGGQWMFQRAGKDSPLICSKCFKGESEHAPASSAREQQPVAWRRVFDDGTYDVRHGKPRECGAWDEKRWIVEPLYASVSASGSTAERVLAWIEKSNPKVVQWAREAVASSEGAAK